MCKAPIRAGHFVEQLWVVAEIHEGLPTTDSLPEAAHEDCDNPARRWAHKTINIHTLKRDDMSTAKVELAPSHQCKHCGLPWQRGDRIVEIVRVEGVFFDATANGPGIKCSSDAEYVHANCADRDLSKGRGIIFLS